MVENGCYRPRKLLVLVAPEHSDVELRSAVRTPGLRRDARTSATRYRRLRSLSVGQVELAAKAKTQGALMAPTKFPPSNARALRSARLRAAILTRPGRRDDNVLTKIAHATIVSL